MGCSTCGGGRRRMAGTNYVPTIKSAGDTAPTTAQVIAEAEKNVEKIIAKDQEVKRTQGVRAAAFSDSILRAVRR